MLDALETSLVAHSIGWALLQFIWQGTLVGVLTALALIGLRRSGADIRYIVACLGLAVMFVLPIATASERYRNVSASSASVSLTDTASPAADPAVTSVAPAAPAMIDRSISRSTAGGTAWWSVDSLETWLPSALIFWLAGVMILSLRLLGSWLLVERLRRDRTHEPPAPWHERVRIIARRLRVMRPVRLLESALVDVPTVIGWIRPVILLPTSAFAGLTVAQLEAVIAHELAHVRRHDYLVNVLQTLVETLLFYHPAVWWVSRRIRIEREHCCDDLAVELCGDRVVYARALADLEELRGRGPTFAVAATGGLLLARIKRLLTMPDCHDRRSATWVAVFTAWMVLALTLAAARTTSGLSDERFDVRPDAASAELVQRVTDPSQGSVDDPSSTIADELITAAEQLEPVLTSFAQSWLGPVTLPPSPSLSFVAPPVPPSPPQAPLPSRPLDDLTLEPPAPPAPALPEPPEAPVVPSAPPAPLVPTASPALPAPPAPVVPPAPVATPLLSSPPAPPRPELPTAPQSPAPPARTAAPQAPAPPPPPEPVYREIGRGQSSWSDGFSHFDVRYRGAITLSDDERDVVSLSPDGFLIVSDGGWLRGGRKLELHGRADGTIDRKFSSGLFGRAYEPEGKAWLAEILPALVRRTGLAADARVTRILKTSGTTGVLDEISQLESDHVRATYFRLLFEKAPLTGAPLAQALQRAGGQIASDHELARLLIDVTLQSLADATASHAYFGAATTIDSDYELQRVLATAANTTSLSATALEEVLDTAISIDSDYELARLLSLIAKRHTLTGPTGVRYFEALSLVDSDYEHQRVLASVAPHITEPALVAAMLDSALGIASDYELARFLITVAERRMVDVAREPFFLAVNTIESAYERRRVLSAVAQTSGLSDQTFEAILRNSVGIQNDHELASLLMGIAERHQLEGSLRQAYVDAANRVSSPYEQTRVLAALVRNERGR